ncbi:MAG: hypothetical protein NDJ92_20415 [Thermoanaerobaculia bacterium]|nr:hypothetical protein [Thermoanaerobaculia bacterium]
MTEKAVPETGRNSIDDVIEVYKRNVDRTLLQENLARTPTERLQRLQQLQRLSEEHQSAGCNEGKPRG